MNEDRLDELFENYENDDIEDVKRAFIRYYSWYNSEFLGGEQQSDIFSADAQRFFVAGWTKRARANLTPPLV